MTNRIDGLLFGAVALANGAASVPSVQARALWIFVALSAIVGLVFVWVVRSTRHPGEHDVQRAYRLRSVLFSFAVASMSLLLVVTLARTPYARADAKPERVVHVAALQFGFRFSEQPLLGVDDFGRVTAIEELRLPAGAPVEFRVTSLDVNHAFAVYSPSGSLVAQTQAMPGYVNRLHVRLDELGEYRVLCLEYCGSGHHFMGTAFSVEGPAIGELRHAIQ